MLHYLWPGEDAPVGEGGDLQHMVNISPAIKIFRELLTSHCLPAFWTEGMVFSRILLVLEGIGLIILSTSVFVSSVTLVGSEI